MHNTVWEVRPGHAAKTRLNIFAIDCDSKRYSIVVVPHLSVFILSLMHTSRAATIRGHVLIKRHACAVIDCHAACSKEHPENGGLGNMGHISTNARCTMQVLVRY